LKIKNCQIVDKFLIPILIYIALKINIKFLNWQTNYTGFSWSILLPYRWCDETQMIRPVHARWGGGWQEMNPKIMNPDIYTELWELPSFHPERGRWKKERKRNFIFVMQTNFLREEKGKSPYSEMHAFTWLWARRVYSAFD
jgi:hypothetical protein